MHLNIKLTISYDGKSFKGWQRLSQQSLKTIQGTIEKALSDYYHYSIKIIGSGRTDAGVHALGQVANFYLKTSSSFEPNALKDYLNTQLSPSIFVKAVEKVPEAFHARFNALSKTYVYRIDNHLIQDLFSRHYSYHISNKLNIDLMRAGCEQLVGTKDFRAFSSDKNSNKSTVKTIYDIQIIDESGIVKITITADGFLYNMVRIIVGTLIEIGLNERNPASIEKILLSKTRSVAGYTVPPHGLFLQEVNY